MRQHALGVMPFLTGVECPANSASCQEFSAEPAFALGSGFFRRRS
ncbi:hypothetical protein [Streptomyces sp. NPDC059533]